MARLKILAVCGMGLGSSTILRMQAEKAVRALGLDASVETADIGSASLPGVDIINVGEIDASALGLGHGYYASRPILTDIFQTLLGISADHRLFIRKSEPSGAEDFFLRP